MHPALFAGLASFLVAIALPCHAMEPLSHPLSAREEPGNNPSSVVLTGRCRRVVDGDSLYLQGVDTQIRLWGVDAPERDEQGYQRAKQKLQDMALNRELRCEQVDIDKYQRIVARCVVVASHLELNREQIESGAAEEYCYFSRGYYGHCR